MNITEILMLILAVLNAGLIGVVVYIGIKYKRLTYSYDYFMKGRDAESLEGLIREYGERLSAVEEEDIANKEAIRILNKNLRGAFQKSGLVHYNAFQGMGGNLSFAVALLDYTNSGFIINSVHSREGCYVYTKTVVEGKTEVLLGAEEQAALEQALGYNE